MDSIMTVLLRGAEKRFPCSFRTVLQAASCTLHSMASPLFNLLHNRENWTVGIVMDHIKQKYSLNYDISAKAIYF